MLVACRLAGLSALEGHLCRGECDRAIRDASSRLAAKNRRLAQKSECILTQGREQNLIRSGAGVWARRIAGSDAEASTKQGRD